MDSVKEKRYYGWYMVMVSAIIYALVYSTTSTGSVFTISITQEQGFSRSLWSSKSIFTCIGSLISCYMSGRLIQRFGLKAHHADFHSRSRIHIFHSADVYGYPPVLCSVCLLQRYMVRGHHHVKYQSLSTGGSGLEKGHCHPVLPWQAPEWEACHVAVAELSL